MISEKYLKCKGLESVQHVYDQTTEYYIIGKFTQARHNLLLMAKDQKKAYFFQVLDLYPTDKTFLEFVMSFI